ncbi:hypothetical protein B9479_005645 [Cryptococcus floricola]|uniref:Uncharacterized protein n=1 Tax=Cryptococcus floricola TaxID=2591691 RepID=A0A5D3AQ96_9TREE|nr:hypothetical protein B9479_005645 [Cryptococcus floricola]
MLTDVLKRTRRHSSDPRPSPHPLRRADSRSTRRSSSTVPTTVSDAGSLGEWEEGDTEEWDGVGPEPHDPVLKTIKKQAEPMSPVEVVLFVVAAWLIYQILSRPDDLESSTPFFPHTQSQAPQPHPQSYQHPYQPHLPSAILPNTASIPSPETSYWGFTLGLATYCFYVVIAVLAIPLSWLLRGLGLVLQIVAALLYPFTAVGRLFLRAFVFYPLDLAKGVLDACWPAITFVGTTLGVGAVFGGVSGWVGSGLVRRYVRWKEGDAGKAERSLRRRSSKSRRRRSESEGFEEIWGKKERRASKSSSSRRRRGYSPDSESSLDVALLGKDLVHDRVSLFAVRSRSTGEGVGVGTAREPVVIGTRRRGRREGLAG